MRILIAFAVPAIVVTTMMHAGAPPPPVPPAMLQVPPAERARIVAAMPHDPSRTAPTTLSSR